MTPLFHLVTPVDLQRYTAGGAYSPPSLASEGFIHLSYLEQVEATRERFYRRVAPLLALQIAPRGLPVREEEATEGRFPHLYGPLPGTSIARVHDMPASGLPDELAFLRRLLGSYAWYDHPEGPKFVETHRDALRTSGHWLFLPGAISAFHQVLDGDELWLVHRGSLLIHVIDPGGSLTTHRLGLGDGEKSVASVPSGHWQAAELSPGETLTFGSNVCAPPFEYERFRLGERDDLLTAFPQHAELVRRLTHDPADVVAAPPRDWRSGEP